MELLFVHTKELHPWLQEPGQSSLLNAACGALESTVRFPRREKEG